MLHHICFNFLLVYTDT